LNPNLADSVSVPLMWAVSFRKILGMQSSDSKAAATAQNSSDSKASATAQHSSDSSDSTDASRTNR
jgi:hypothetical protein